MDHAVALVQAYLHVNGYFTVAEYPVIEAATRGSYRTATDIDLLALRLPRAGGIVPAGRADSGGFVSDPELGGRPEQPELLLAEVKEGRAELNRGASDRRVVAAVLRRFGCCERRESDERARQLVQQGEASTERGLLVRLAACGSTVPSGPTNYLPISLAHVLEYLQGHLAEHWHVLRHVQVKDPIFGLLLTLEKASRGVGESGRKRGAHDD